MKLILPSLFIGLIAGGTAGWLAADARVKGQSGETNVMMSDDEVIASIESRVRALEDRDEQSSPTLDAPVQRDGSIDHDALLRAAIARLEERIAAGALDKQLNALTDKHLATRGLPADQSLKDWIASQVPEFGVGTPRKRVTLAEAARELEMTQGEEESLREMSTELGEEMIKLLSNEDESVNDIKREFEEARKNPDKKTVLMGKFMGRAIANAPKLMELMSSFRTRGTKILGPERWTQFERGYKVIDLDPYRFAEMLGH